MALVVCFRVVAIGFYLPRLSFCCCSRIMRTSVNISVCNYRWNRLYCNSVPISKILYYKNLFSNIVLNSKGNRNEQLTLSRVTVPLEVSSNVSFCLKFVSRGWRFGLEEISDFCFQSSNGNHHQGERLWWAHILHTSYKQVIWNVFSKFPPAREIPFTLPERTHCCCSCSRMSGRVSGRCRNHPLC